ncbi:MAG TPA: 5-demethoxyubiquinol-8 5-hydroxylase UbiM [Steroidobacteraceae bacterium]
MKHFDVIIIGAGPVGLNFAAGLLEAGLEVAIVEQQPRSVLANPPYDGREIALTHASVQRLRDNGVWDRIPASEISPLRDACVWNGSSLACLRIDHRDGPRDQLGFLVPNHWLRRAVFERLQDARRLTWMCESRVADVTIESGGRSAQVQLADGTELSASLLVAADTRFSQSRRAAGIGARSVDFGRTMVLCRVQHERPHDQIAHEWFDYGQTIAMLPLNGACSSLIVTVDHQQARRLMNLEPAQFAAEMERRTRQRWGALQILGERYAYPLVGVYADRFVAHRYALIGDAAVGMHPVTAHGFNLGLLGQATLARKIVAAAASGHDIGDPELLARYDRAHRRATLPLYLATNAIVQLYTSEAPPLRLLRHALLRAAQYAIPIRRMLTASLMQVR